jgi:flagellar motility protein MotE (MotC chaperone)
LNLKILYAASFLAVFLIVTGGVMYVNTVFKNIFAFDFSPVNQSVTEEHEEPAGVNENVSMDEIKKYFDSEFKNQILDSLKLLSPSGKTDTVVQTVLMDSSLIDSLVNLHKLLAAKTKAVINKQPTVDIKPVVTPVVNKPDSNYTAWVQKTAGLYESMDSKKAAKIIQNYSDNVARDIIYIMKKKKAAEILAELNPDFAIKITNSK